MKRRWMTCWLALWSLAMMADSERINFDFNWRFMEGDAPGAEQPDYDDGGWIAVDLPHDWDACKTPNKDAAMGNDGGYYQGGMGWYRKKFVSKEAEQTWIYFEGVYQKCEIYVNGHHAGTHEYGYTPFRVNVSSYLKMGQNLVAVKVNNSLQPNCRWYSGSGIYRHVWLETQENLHIAENGVYVTTPEVNSLQSLVEIKVDLENDSPKSRTVSVKAEGDTRQVTLGAGEKKSVTISLRVDSPKLWSPETPYLYQTCVKVTEGERLVDHKEVRYGVRTLVYDAQKGFLLNGKPTKINGACVHHDDGVLGAMALDAAEIRKVRLMKEAGFNLIRTSHNPTTRAFLDACDSLGMMVIDEMYDGWYRSKTRGDHHTAIDSCYKEDFEALVKTDRNHPSIICWSIGNEVIERTDIGVITTARKFKREILRWDRTRPVTEALCSWGQGWEIFDPHAEVLDIMGYNYMMHEHESDHKRCPERVMWQTESYPREAFLNWNRTASYPYIIGDIVWTGLDYLGESGIGQFYHEGEPRSEHFQGKHFPYHGAYCGDVDITGWRKPISHYRDILWNETEQGCESEIYLAVREPSYYENGPITETQWSVWPTWESWNWKGWEGKEIEAEIYTKAPAVNLYLNGKLVETRQVNRQTEYKAIIALKYEPGELKAVAVDEQGKEGKSCTLVTAGTPNAIRLTAERSVIHADGEDLAYVVMEVVDKQGRVVPDAAIEADATISGEGKLMAAASAWMKDLEPLTSNHVTTYRGRALIVARSTQKGGKIEVRTKSGLKAGKCVIRTR